MLKFMCLGSGSNGNAYFLFSENFGILIDAGIGVRALKKYFRAMGKSLADINAILITHDHADHIKSVGVLAKEYSLPVYATKKVHEGINRNYSVTTKLSQDFVHYIEKEHAFVLGGFRIEAFDVPHDSSDNVGYSITYEDVNFCLLTDVGHISDNIPAYISAANYLVLEANHDTNMLAMGPYPAHLKERISGGLGHLNNQTAAEVLVNNMTEKLRHVWLCHLSEENNHPELARKTVTAHLRSYGIVVGKDVGLDVLKRRIPSEIFELR